MDGRADEDSIPHQNSAGNERMTIGRTFNGNVFLNWFLHMYEIYTQSVIEFREVLNLISRNSNDFPRRCMVASLGGRFL